jgi:transcriptional regulator with XRE-family HTH domain
VGIQLDRAAISKIENGHRHVLDYELRALAEVLGADVDKLLGKGKK